MDGTASLLPRAALIPRVGILFSSFPGRRDGEGERLAMTFGAPVFCNGFEVPIGDVLYDLP